MVRGQSQSQAPFVGPVKKKGKERAVVSEVSDNLVSSRECVVKLGSALSHIPLCHAFTYLIDG